MTKLGHRFKAFIIVIKTPSYPLKINKRTNKKYLQICYDSFSLFLFSSDML